MESRYKACISALTINFMHFSPCISDKIVKKKYYNFFPIYVTFLMFLLKLFFAEIDVLMHFKETLVMIKYRRKFHIFIYKILQVTAVFMFVPLNFFGIFFCYPPQKNRITRTISTLHYIKRKKKCNCTNISFLSSEFI